MPRCLRAARVAALCLPAFCLPSVAVAQTATVQVPTATIAAPAPPASNPNALRVDDDTMVRLMVLNEVSTKTTKAGERFVLRVDEDVVVGGVTIIPVGAKAWGEVVSAEGSGAVGKRGKLQARLLYIEQGGERIPIKGENATAGASGTGNTVMGVLALGPLGLFARGNNAKLKAGEIFNGYINGDMLFDRTTSRFSPAAAEAVAAMGVPRS